MTSRWGQWSDISVYILPAACGLMLSWGGKGFYKELFQTGCKYQRIVKLQCLMPELNPYLGRHQKDFSKKQTKKDYFIKVGEEKSHQVIIAYCSLLV